MKVLTSLLAVMIFVGHSNRADCAEESRTAPDKPAVAANLADLRWLVGEWRGPGIDKAEATEIWTDPRDGQMVGLFRQLDKKGEISFYEIMTLVQVGNTIEMRIKHFDKRLHGWEKQDEVTTFALLATRKGMWQFDGLTLKRLARNRATITVRIKEAADQEVTELSFHYQRLR
jgi:Domain of unknown function (DUF6265)